MGITWNAAALILAVLPGAFAWWSGTRLLRFADDPALGERTLTRATHVTQAATVAIVLLLFLPGSVANWFIPLVILGVAFGGFPARRRLLDETWSFGRYLVFMARFWVGWLGFWMLLAASPYIVFSGGRWSAVAAVVVALLLIAWYVRQHAVFLMMLGARRVDPPPHFRSIQQRSKVGEAALWRVPVPGGRLATAFAVPGGRTPAVVFTDTVLESLTEAEQAAVFAHELAHLEHLAARGARRWLERGVIGGLIVIGAFAPLVPGAALWMVLAWAIVILLVFGSAMARNRALEEASDRRAVELCGDAAALERALIKLTVLAGLPRRWSLDLESSSTHPSLARRIQALRALSAAGPSAGGQGVPQSHEASRREESAQHDAPVIVNRKGHPLVFGPHHLEWVDGDKARRMAYERLAELRIHAGLTRRASLQVTDVRGNSWRIPLEPGDVAEVQAALDRIDTRLTQPKTISRTAQLFGRILGLVLLTLAWFAPLFTREVAFSVSALAAAVTLLVAPALASLAAVIVVAGVLAVVSLLREAGDVGAVIAGVMAFVAAGAALLAVRMRRAPQPAGARTVTVLFLLLPAIGFWGPMTTYALAEAEGLVVLSNLSRHALDLWLLPTALSASLLVSTRGRLRWLALVPLLLVAMLALLIYA